MSVESGKGKILIIEDNSDHRFLLKTILSKEKYQIVEAKGGTEALSILSSGTECPDLILLDLTLNDISGPELMEKIKALPNCSDAKVIVVSGWDDLAKRAQEIGADGYLRKPVEIDKLLQEIKRLLIK